MVGVVIGLWIFLFGRQYLNQTRTVEEKKEDISKNLEATISAEIINDKEVTIIDVGETKEIKKFITTPTPDDEKWGVAKQIGEVTWTMKLGEDATMATPKEVFEALNEYRRVHGSQLLAWDEKLGSYAQSRASYLDSIKNVDQHKGFNDFVQNEDGFNKLGFDALGENISYGYKLNGTHIIEWMYAGDEPHNNNQLNNKWNYVGIGVKGLATCLIFGTGKF